MLRKLLSGDETIVIAHRGAFYEAPENTLMAFEKAVELGADMVELDVRMCKSGEIVVIHDADVRRTSNGEGLVREMTLEELKKLDFGEGEKIPTLEETLEFAKNKIPLNIEIKEPDIVENVVKLLEKHGMVEQVIISSFYHQVLPIVKKLNPSILTAPLIMHRPTNVVVITKETNSDGLHPYFEFLDKETVMEAKENNLFINVWTVDDPEEMKRLKNIGITGIITNDVRTAKEVLE